MENQIRIGGSEALPQFTWIKPEVFAQCNNCLYLGGEARFLLEGLRSIDEKRPDPRWEKCSDSSRACSAALWDVNTSQVGVDVVVTPLEWINSALVRNRDKMPGVNFSTFLLVQLRIKLAIQEVACRGKCAEKAKAPSA